MEGSCLAGLKSVEVAGVDKLAAVRSLVQLFSSLFGGDVGAQHVLVLFVAAWDDD